ncbi:carboxymuconolactone decarboxylase family protein [Mycolicibacterium vaccae]|uniref:carboxymuconolactone decarboxylase family protein n=1 Tax=Mycolicibacterium vaccae TaxID=1810 RepID=UPI003CF00C71
MTDSDPAGRARRAYADIMTQPAADDSPVAVTMLDAVFAGVWQRPGLSRRDRHFISLACVAAADAEFPLHDHVYAALNSGELTIVEMREAVLHFAVYGGWPKASRFSMIVDQQWQRIHRDRGTEVPPAPPLLPLTTPSDPEQRLAVGVQAFKDINCLEFAPGPDHAFHGAGILNFVFGEMWLRPGLGMRERRLLTVTCVAFQDAPYPIVSHVYAALKSRDLSFDEIDELALHFAAYYGWPKAAHLSRVISEQKVRVAQEWASEGFVAR